MIEHIDYVVKKLDKFCGLICRVRQLYPRKCLLMFYKCFAKSVICYGLSVYGISAKTNLKKKSKLSEKNFESIFFRKKLDSLADILVENKIFTVSELYIIEMIKEFFKQLRCGVPLQSIDVLKNNRSQYPTRRNSKGLFSSKYNRTVVKKKSVENTSQKAYNCLKYIEFSLINHSLLSQAQVKKLATKIGQLYVVDNRELFSVFFSDCMDSTYSRFNFFFSNCLIVPVRYNNFLMRYIFYAKSGGDSKSN